MPASDPEPRRDGTYRPRGPVDDVPPAMESTRHFTATTHLPTEVRPVPPKRFKPLLVALAAVAAIYATKATGLDRGLVDRVMAGLIEAVYPTEVPEPAPAASAGVPEDE